jgi:hypothetical protein
MKISLYLKKRAGCGMHIETALAGVKEEDRCKCERGSVFGSLFGSGKGK